MALPQQTLQSFRKDNLCAVRQGGKWSDLSIIPSGMKKGAGPLIKKKKKKEREKRLPRFCCHGSKVPMTMCQQ